MTRPPMMRLFDIAEWMRITYHEYSSFCVEFKGSLIGQCTSYSGKSEEELHDYNLRRQIQLLRFVREYSRFDEYYLNDSKLDSFVKFKCAISKNVVGPRKG